MDQPQLLLQDIPRRSALCFTGHRPAKLPSGAKLEALTEVLRFYIDYAIDLGYTLFFTGMADGIDYYAAAYLFERRKVWPELNIIGVQPCTDFSDMFRGYDMNPEHLRCMRENVDILIELPGSFRTDRGVFRRRNYFMADHSGAVIAVCDKNSRSGSMQTLRYAQKSGLSGVRIEPEPDRPLPLLPERWPVEHFGL